MKKKNTKVHIHVDKSQYCKKAIQKYITKATNLFAELVILEWGLR